MQIIAGRSSREAIRRGRGATMIVVKVGGSLYDHPRLGDGLARFLAVLNDAVLLVPGGGVFADAVRKLDRVHRLGDSAAHLLALEAMNASGRFLEWLVSPALADGSRLRLFDAHRTPLPPSWDVTSDSIALRAAIDHGASRLILLKSVDVAGDWEEAARRGWVDAYFPIAVREAKMPIEVVNFRRVLDDHERFSATR
jgi:aspartokinase-like uncharacterized kinase